MQTNTLFQKYLGIVNEALEKNRTQTPYRQILSLTEKMLGDRDIQVVVFADDADEPHDFFTITMKGGHFEMTGHGKDEHADLSWKLPQDHMKEVVENPSDYVEHPARLDLSWLEHRLGLSRK